MGDSRNTKTDCRRHSAVHERTKNKPINACIVVYCFELLTCKRINAAKINRQIENSTHRNHANFNLKLGTRYYVFDITHHATFGSNRSSGASTK